MNNEYTIRFVTTADAQAVLKIYAPYVLNTANTFEYEVPGVEEFGNRIAKISKQYPYLVCEYNGEIVGYAYGSMHRERTAYQWSLETTVYLSEQYHRRGIAKALYTALFDILRLQGYYSIYVSVLLSNIKSVEFHRSMGFEDIGLFKNIGYKLGEWHTNLWMQYFLQEHIAEPAAPIAIGEIVKREEYKKIMADANSFSKILTS